MQILLACVMTAATPFAVTPLDPVTTPAIARSAPLLGVEDDKAAVSKLIRGAVSQVLEVLRNEEISREQKQDSVLEIVEPLIDFELLAKLSLGKTHWGRINAEQRRAFTDLFVDTLRLSYFEKLELFSDEEVEFGEPSTLSMGGSPKYQVDSHIISKGNRVQVAYMLASRNGVWKVFDLEIEGVSIRKSYGGQYNDYLRENDFEELLEEMRKKVEEKRAALAKLNGQPSAPAGE